MGTISFLFLTLVQTQNLTELNLDANGYTILTRSPDSRVVYVSSSEGSDSNSGLSEAQPKRTIAAAYSLLRDGYPDWLLFKKGDTFTDTINLAWNRSGRSVSEPTVYGSYGTGPRPLLNRDNLDGVNVWGATNRNYIAIVGLHFRNTTDSAGNEHTGINFVNVGTNLLIEDCKVEGFSNNVIVDGFGGVRTDTKIRRNVLLDGGRFGNAFNGGTSVYTAHYDGLLIEDNVMDHQRWRENGDINDPTNRYLSHHLYIGENNPANNVIRGNIAYNGGRTNFNQRSGGLIENNLSLRGAQGITTGISYAAGEATATVRNNVILESRDNQSLQPLGFGVSFEKMSSLLMENNIIAKSTDGHDHRSINLESTVRNATIRKNLIFDWQSNPTYGYNTVKIGSNTTAIIGPVNFVENIFHQNNDSRLVSFESNGIPAGITFSGNKYFSTRGGQWWFNVWDSIGDRTLTQWISSMEPNASTSSMQFPDSTRSVQTYMASLGRTNTTTEGFMYEAAQMSKDNFRPAYTAAAFNNYMRAGFGIVGCEADMNDDGNLNVLDFSAFLNKFAAHNPRADINHDGNLNVLDFNAYLNAFSVGCAGYGVGSGK